jgi:hypothetical protein
VSTLTCIGPPTGPNYVRCERAPVARTPYRSCWQQRPICLECATVWQAGNVPEIVNPYSQGSEFHYTALHPSEMA